MKAPEKSAEAVVAKMGSNVPGAKGRRTDDTHHDLHAASYSSMKPSLLENGLRHAAEGRKEELKWIFSDT
ncbi:hypothetical protein D3C80_1852450 [compost metagenome]